MAVFILGETTGDVILLLTTIGTGVLTRGDRARARARGERRFEGDLALLGGLLVLLGEDIFIEAFFLYILSFLICF